MMWVFWFVAGGVTFLGVFLGILWLGSLCDERNSYPDRYWNVDGP